MNQKNTLGLDKCFLDLDNPFELFHKWFEEAKKNEINDPNALALGTASKEGIPSVRMVLLKDFDENRYCILEIKDDDSAAAYGDSFNIDEIFLAHSLKIEFVIDNYRDEANEYYRKRHYNCG